MNAQPIATAPRDGTHILAANLKQAHPIWTAVHWFDDGWFLSVNELEIHAGWQCDRLTHWLPQPPTELAALPEPYGWVYSFPQGMNHQFSLTRRYDMPGWIEIPLYAAQSVTVDAEAAAKEIHGINKIISHDCRRGTCESYINAVAAIIRQHSHQDRAAAKGYRWALVPEQMTDSDIKGWRRNRHLGELLGKEDK